MSLAHGHKATSVKVRVAVGTRWETVPPGNPKPIVDVIVVLLRLAVPVDVADGSTAALPLWPLPLARVSVCHRYRTSSFYALRLVVRFPVEPRPRSLAASFRAFLSHPRTKRPAVAFHSQRASCLDSAGPSLARAPLEPARPSA